MLVHHKKKYIYICRFAKKKNQRTFKKFRSRRRPTIVGQLLYAYGLRNPGNSGGTLPRNPRGQDQACGSR